MKSLSRLKTSSIQTFKASTVAFLGLGNLANKIGPRLLLNNPDNLIRGFSPSGRQREYANTYPSMQAVLNDTNISHLFYMFKPQHWNSKLKQEINQCIEHFAVPPVKVSVLAGLGVDELECDISCMPNVLSEVGYSYTFANTRAGFNKSQKDEFTNLCQHMGPIHWVENAHEMHLAVACSGSAPAYVMYAMDKAVKMAKLSGMEHTAALEVVIAQFKKAAEIVKNALQNFDRVDFADLYANNLADPYLILILRFIEAYCFAMRKLGLEEDIANAVSWNTVYGTAELIAKNLQANPELDILTIMQQIMSKGGTTEQAIAVARDANFDIINTQDDLNEFMFNILHAAFSRSIELQNAAKKKVNGLADSSMFKPVVIATVEEPDNPSFKVQA